MLKTGIIKLFLWSAGALLLTTAIGKLVSASGSAHILKTSDPVLFLPFRDVFWIVGTIELFVAFVCFFGKRIQVQAGLLAWLSTSFLLYRFGLLYVGYHKPCSCMGQGNLIDALHITPQTADTMMKFVLGYLLVGSYATLIWLWKKNAKSSSMALSSTEASKSAA